MFPWFTVHWARPDWAATASEPAMFPLKDLVLGLRAEKVLTRLGCRTLGDVTRFSSQEIGDLPNCWSGTVTEIRVKLAAFGLALRGESPTGPHKTLQPHRKPPRKQV